MNASSNSNHNRLAKVIRGNEKAAKLACAGLLRDNTVRKTGEHMWLYFKSCLKRLPISCCLNPTEQTLPTKLLKCFKKMCAAHANALAATMNFGGEGNGKRT